MSDTNNPAFPPNHDPNTHEFGLTKRQYAAIKLKVPDSGEEWLDDMIRQSLLDDFAAKALQGLLASEVQSSLDKFVDYSYRIADSMLKAMEA